MTVLTVGIHNATPPAWQAVITGATATFYNRDGTNSIDSKPGINITSGGPEAQLHSTDVDCVTSIDCAIAVKDRRGIIQVIRRSFKDPLGRECSGDQNFTLGQAPADLTIGLALHADEIVFTLEVEPG